MTITELMAGVEPDVSLEGIATADDFVFGLNLAQPAADEVGGYLVAQAGVIELSGAMSAVTAESQYLRTGLVTTKTGNSKAFTLSAERCRGDAFQEALLAHAMKWATGANVVKDYVYLDMLTGKGEKGRVSVNIEGDFAGAAGAGAGVSATFHVQGTPEEFVWQPA